MRDFCPWVADVFRLKKFRIWPTVRRKTKKRLMIIVPILLITSYFCYLIWYQFCGLIVTGMSRGLSLTLEGSMFYVIFALQRSFLIYMFIAFYSRIISKNQLKNKGRKSKMIKKIDPILLFLFSLLIFSPIFNCRSISKLRTCGLQKFW